MLFFLHTHPSRPWPHLPSGQNKALSMPLPGSLELVHPLKDRSAGAMVRRETLLVPRPFFRASSCKAWSLWTSGNIASEPSPRARHTQGPQHHPVMPWDRQCLGARADLAQIGGQKGCYRYITRALPLIICCFHCPKHSILVKTLHFTYIWCLHKPVIQCQTNPA